MLMIRLTSKSLRAGSVRVQRLVGHEALSSLFEWQLDVVAADADDPVETQLSELLDQPVRIELVDDDGARTHHVSGIVRSIETEAPRHVGGPLQHRVVVVPRVWRATQDVRSRIVRRQSAPDTAIELIGRVDETLDPEKDLDVGGVTRPAADYRVQYEEPTFSFVSRLLEDEGIAYRFVHRDRGEQLVLFDHNEALPDALRIPYVQQERPEARRAVVSMLRRRVATVPRQITLRDYDDLRPFQPPQGIAAAPEAAVRRVGTIITNQEAIGDEATGARLAQTRMDEHVAGQRIYQGRSSLHELHAGDRICVEHGPFGGGDDLELLVIEVRHEVTIDETRAEQRGYENEFVAIDASTPYRPARRTPKPRIFGLTYGMIVGPDLGPVAPVDELGRYLVSFFYAPGANSPFIRRVQPLAGQNAGIHFPLALGTEVAVAYLDGDPDRPVILGAVPNLLTASPVVMKNATQSVIQTSSGARFEIDDNA